MVKFSKELEAQLIPEWKDAFVNYWQLKKHIKKIKLARNKRPTQLNHGFGRSIVDPIRFIAMKLLSTKLFFSSNNNTNTDDDETVKRNRVSAVCFPMADNTACF
ncbi:hypothetical protein GOBAR_DD34676 [Gossypium barbadense]|nr:hypothetical protein GOBAR_DD34676 [Gossypium barbadense]